MIDIVFGAPPQIFTRVLTLLRLAVQQIVLHHHLAMFKGSMIGFALAWRMIPALLHRYSNPLDCLPFPIRIGFSELGLKWFKDQDVNVKAIYSPSDGTISKSLQRTDPSKLYCGVGNEDTLSRCLDDQTVFG